LSNRIDTDVNRFKHIIRNNIKNNLGKHISSEKLIGQQGNKTISIPINRIDLPRFVYGNGGGGAGQGDGDPGDPMDGSQKGKGKGKAGKDSEEHVYTAEFTAEELAGILAEELQLPKLENKGKGKVNSVKDRYSGIRSNGAEGLRHFKRTYKEALIRNIASGNYDPANPQIIPIKDDKRYKAPKFKEEPDCNTAVIYMMDVSGSMGEEQKHIVKSEVFWIDLWLKSQYKSIETRFIVHDSESKEVTREEFFSISEAGGTCISSAYDLCAEIMSEDYPFADWNVYPFHFSDGDNWGDDDNNLSCNILKNFIIPNSNVFSYGQVSGGSGDFINVLKFVFENEDKVTLSSIESANDILQSLKDFFKKGK
jgi:uncharacterized sporulation protein YeaH/YhbH (DUF444 family)